MLAERVYPLAERKEYLQQITAKMRGTPAANQAAQELARLPTDEEIEEIDAEFALTTAERAPPGQWEQELQDIIAEYGETKVAEVARRLLTGEIREAEAQCLLETAKKLTSLGQRKRAFQAIIDKYGETKAGEEAGQLLLALPSDDVMREMEAQSLVDTAKEQMEDNKLNSARENLNAAKKLSPGGLAADEAERLIVEVNELEVAEQLRQAILLLDSNPAAARRRLRDIVRDSPNTRAAVEAQRLLK
jgi:hypothetical protein